MCSVFVVVVLVGFGICVCTRFVLRERETGSWSNSFPRAFTVSVGVKPRISRQYDEDTIFRVFVYLVYVLCVICCVNPV